MGRFPAGQSFGMRAAGGSLAVGKSGAELKHEGAGKKGVGGQDAAGVAPWIRWM